jgi:hypothetical protein
VLWTCPDCRFDSTGGGKLGTVIPMSTEFWAGVVLAPAAFVLFVLFATRLYLDLTKRSIRFDWIRTITGLESGHSTATGVTIIAIAAVVISQFSCDRVDHRRHQ